MELVLMVRALELGVVEVPVKVVLLNQLLAKALDVAVEVAVVVEVHKDLLWNANYVVEKL